CTAMGMTATCDGSCADSGSLGNGECDEALACEANGWDGGDCCPDEQLPICWQFEGDPLWCAWASGLGDGFCDVDFDCEGYGYDAGDCLDCGDNLCEEGEDETSCPADCAAQPGEACYPEAGGVGTVDCSGECYMGASSEACDEVFNCPEANYDWGECIDAMPTLVINEIDVRSVAGSQTEFIELFNPTDEVISLDGYVLNLYTALGGFMTMDVSAAFYIEDGVTMTAPDLAPGEFLVVGFETTLQAQPDGAVILGMLGDPEGNDDGAVELVLDGGVVDGVAWADDGDLVHHGEGTPVAADTIADSLNRCPDGADTNDNLTDFSGALPTPGGPNWCDSDPGVTFADVNAIFNDKCGGCHTGGSSGGHSIGSSDLDLAYSDSQLMSYSEAGQTKGAACADRIASGSMPPGEGCGGVVSDNATNSDVCITDSEYDILLDWLDAGQPGP
ncbi:MAG: lamin tail domain-containing protein, partial [Myxococcota bacterium]|nr:lamin tail domain-containing protein [Myxococcota bacterium]